MAIAIGEAIATGGDARDEAVQDTIVARWLGWSRTAKDVGIQTHRYSAGPPARESQRSGPAPKRPRLHQRTGRSAGNGSLMRTAPLALAYLDDEQGLVEAARAISELTHFDPDAGDACVLWTVAIRHAVLTAELDVRVGLRHRRRTTRAVVGASGCRGVPRPADIDRNGWTVAALQAAWSAIVHTVPGPDAPRADHLRLGLDAAVRAGNDTTPSRPSPAVCSGRPTAPPRCRWSGGAAARLARNARARSGQPRVGHIARGGKPDRLTPATSTPRSTPSRSTRMTTRCLLGGIGSFAQAAGRGRRGGLAVPAGRR